MFSSNTSSLPSSRPIKTFPRRSGMQRSGSILNTIKNIVAAPLSWFASSDTTETGKRRRDLDDREPTGEVQEQDRRKKMRVETDPFHNTNAGQQNTFTSSQSAPSFQGSEMLRTHIFQDRKSTPAVGLKTLAINPSTHDDRDVSMASSPVEAHFKVIHGSPSMGPRGSSLYPPPSPLRLRNSLTPQPSSARLIRREASAPPPISNLMANPIFVKAPKQTSVPREISERNSLSLGSLAEFERLHSPSIDRSLARLGSMPSLSSLTLSGPPNVRDKDAAEKTFRELEMYKTPIVPSRYKDAKVIPDFLKLRRSHVPIPVSRKEEESLPSLGFADRTKAKKEKGKGKYEGKPYARPSLGKILARRNEEDADVKSRSGADRDVEKRDVGVSAGFTSDKEDRDKDDFRKPSSQYEDPFSKQLSLETRSGPYGRVGRTRLSRRDPGLRSVPLSTRGKSNRFSATFEEEDSFEELASHDLPKAGEQIEKTLEKKPAQVFAPPNGFSFASSTTIQHDHVGAKEPPISSLPFSITKPTDTVSIIQRSEVASPENTLPYVQETLRSPSQADASILTKNLTPPKLATIPPAPERPKETTMSTAQNLFFTTPISTQQTSTSIASTSSVPNFFANSTYVSSKPHTQTLQTSTFVTSANTPSLVSTPIQGVEKPLWSPVVNSTKPASSFAVQMPKLAEPIPSQFSDPSGPSTSRENTKMDEETSTLASKEKNNFFSTIDSGPKAVSHLTPSSTASGDSRSHSNQSLFPPTESESHSSTPIQPPAANLLTNITFSPVQQKQSTAAISAVTINKADVPSLSAKDDSSEKPSVTFSFGPSTVTQSTAGAPTEPQIVAPKPMFSEGFTFGSNTFIPATAAPLSTSPFTFGSSSTDKKDSLHILSPSSSSGTPSTFGPGAGVSGTRHETATPTIPTPAPFTFGSTPARNTTPPRQDEREERMDESPTRMDVNGGEKATAQSKTLTFSMPVSGGFEQTTSTSMPTFTFGSSVSSNPFEVKQDAKANGFSFGRVASAPVISTSFSFNKSSDGSTTPTGASTFGAGSFGQPSTSVPFTFGSTAPTSNHFLPVTQGNISTPGSPFQTTSSFSFGSSQQPSTSNPFAFTPSQPSSPATSVSGLPQSPANPVAPFAFGQPSISNSSSAPALFNIGAAPASALGSNAARPTKKLPRRGPAKR